MTRTQRWYAIVSIAVLNTVWSLVGVLSGETISVGPVTVWIIFGGALILLTLIFYYLLYREISAIQDSDSTWNPDPRIWVGGGMVLTLTGSVLFLNPFTHYVTVLYIVQRLRKPISPVSQSKIG